MRADPGDLLWPDMGVHAPGSAVLHLVGRVTETVFSFLGPATAALAAQGFAQTVVLIDDPRYRHLLTKFDDSVRLVLVNADAPHADTLRELLDAYCDSARVKRPVVAHLHGVVCSVLGQFASSLHSLDVPMYFTPHGSKTLAPLRGLRAALPWVMKPLAGRLGDRVIASSGHDARTLKDITRQTVHLIESPVAPAFFEAVLQPMGTARIVTGCRAPNPEGAALFAQCAVLLTHEAPELRFSWIGSVNAESAAQLHAAQVEVLDLEEDADRAAYLATAAVFVAPEGVLGFPVFLAEAMALGLPCVAWDTPYHRDVVRDGETGFLCANADDALLQLSRLLESPSLRQSMGLAGRELARARFDGTRFREALLGVYGARSLT